MYWHKTQLCLPETLPAQQTSAYAGSRSSCSQTCKLAYDLQRNGISFILDYLLSIGNRVEHSSAKNSELVLDPTAFHLHKIGFHGSSRLVCSGLEGCCLA